MPLISLVPQAKETDSDSTVPSVLILGVWISNTVVKTLLLKVESGTVTLVRDSQVKTYQNLEDVVTVTDGLLQELGPESEKSNDVLFIVDGSWVKDGDISAEKKPFIKAITTELDLSPIGFVEQTEAVTNFAIQNNPRFSGIFASIEKKSVSITVVERAVTTGTQVVGRSGQISKDIIEGLARFSQVDDEKASYLPPQLFLLSLEEDEESLKEIQQALLSEPFTEVAKFLQTPMISVVSQDEYISRVVQEAGVAIADAKGLASAKRKATIPLKDQIKKVSDETANVRPVSAEELGFSEVTSRASESAQPADKSADDGKESDDVPTSFGIPIMEGPIQKKPEPTESGTAAPQLDTKVSEEKEEQPKKSKQKAGMGFFAKHHMNTKLFVSIGAGLGVVVLLLLGGLFVFLRSSAQVAVTLSSKVIATEATIEVDADIPETDVENVVLAADRVEYEVSGQNTILTTGVKVVGENAKGTVTLYNKTTADKDFSAGTVLATGDREFTLDEDITVPAATVTETSSGEEKEYGTAETGVTATDIGAEGNISKDTELSVGAFADSTYEARVNDDFSGGSSREVRVVAAADQAEAVKELQAELLERAQSELQDSAESGEYILPTLTILEKEVAFSSDIDDEVNEVTASVTLTVEALVYTAESLQPLAAALLESEVPEGYVLSEETPSILSQPLEDEAASESATLILANITSEALPVLNLDDLFQFVLGKSVEDATRNLEDHEGISEVTVTMSPGFLSTLPNDKDRVEIFVVEKEE